ncbi:MAG: ankyrin repeat domain-containing protein [Fimbriimonadaceae bacterium]|nr:ankyrin repeat domain-containing protein [Fimbriimonadaceae bacterium]
MEYRGTPLHQAAKAGDFEEVKRLVESGVDPKIKDENGERAAWEAFGRGHYEIGKYLVDQGGDLNYTNNAGISRAGEYNYPKKND